MFPGICHWTEEDKDIFYRQFIVPIYDNKIISGRIAWGSFQWKKFDWGMLMGDRRDAKIMNRRSQIKVRGTAKEVALQFVRSIQ